MTNLQTDPKLIDALESAAGRNMTAIEIREQRISFVMSAIKESSGVSRADVGKIIDEREGIAD